MRSLSDSLRPIVDVVDLFSSYNCRVQIEIWLRDSHNWFYLLLTIRTARFLNRMGMSEILEVAMCRLSVWCWMARGMISKRTKTEHYSLQKEESGKILIESSTVLNFWCGQDFDTGNSSKLKNPSIIDQDVHMHYNFTRFWYSML